eukprot:tig00000189_g14318.t1
MSKGKAEVRAELRRMANSNPNRDGNVDVAHGQCHCGASLKQRSAFVFQKDKTHVFCEACVKRLLGAEFGRTSTRGKKLPGPRIYPFPGCAPRSSDRRFCTCRHCADLEEVDDHRE